jgi:hypothetical protein
MQAGRNSETLEPTYDSVRWNNPKDDSRCDSPKTYIIVVIIIIYVLYIIEDINLMQFLSLMFY